MGAKRHFLLVDEDINELRLFVDAFKKMKLDCKCTYAKDIEHAMKIMEYVTPEKLFVSLDPDVSGTLEHFKNIRRNKNLKAVEIVAYCANMSYYQLLAHGLGANVCINTPREVGKVAELIHNSSISQA